MAVKVPQNEGISGERRGKIGVGSAICRIRENKGSINIGNESEEKLFRKMLIPT